MQTVTERPRNRELELPIIGVLAVSLLLYFMANTVVKKENEAADKAFIGASARENERLLHVVNNRESENRRKNAETLYGACVRERDNALSELNSRILNDAADSRPIASAEPTHLLSASASAASLRTNNEKAGASRIARGTQPLPQAPQTNSTTGVAATRQNAEGRCPEKGSIPWLRNLKKTFAATLNAASLSASSATDIGYASGRAVTTASINSSGGSARPPKSEGEKWKTNDAVVSPSPTPHGVPVAPVGKLSAGDATQKQPAGATRVREGGFAGSATSGIPESSDEPCEIESSQFAGSASGALAEPSTVPSTDTNATLLRRPSGSGVVVLAAQDEFVGSRRMTATPVEQAAIASRPETPPDCSFSTASANGIAKANDWSAHGAGKWFQCRGDLVDRYFADMAARAPLPPIPPIDYYFDRGFEFPDQPCEFARTVTLDKCDGCNVVNWCYGYDYCKSYDFIDAEQLGDDAHWFAYAMVERHEVVVHFIAPCQWKAFEYAWGRHP